MIYLLDTDVVSQARKHQPNESVDKWMRMSIPTESAISVMTVHELRAGAELLPVGQRRFSLEKWIATFVMKRFEGQILPVTVEIADLAAVRTIAAKSRSHNIELADALIAATAEVHNLQVVTLNRRHFQHLGVRLVNL